nr:Pup--protein ligase [Schaalia sp. lx-100]
MPRNSFKDSFRKVASKVKRRVFGIETEYGLTAATLDGTPASLNADEAARELFTPLIQQYRSTNLFLRNGGRLYLDVGSHPEYATAECDRLDDLLAQDRAGSRLFTDLAAQADRRLEEHGRPERMYLFRNNVDSQGNSYGCHENYLLHRRRDFRQVADALVAFFITRQALVGSGYIRRTPAGAVYCTSQRAEHMWDAVSSATTRSRPIINTRDEPLADSTSYRRMHVIVGDTNVCEATTALKIGATQLILDAIEEGIHLEDLALADPMGAIRQLNTGNNTQVRLDLADGRSMTAAQIQREIYERVLRRCPAEEMTSLLVYVVDLWDRAIHALDTNDWTQVDTELDHVIKKKLIDAYMSRTGCRLSDPRIARLDLSYHDITASGLADRMEKTGLMKRLSTDEEVASATRTPPLTTRAYLRGKIIGAAQDAHVDLAADWVHIRPEYGNAQPLSLQDPFACEDVRVDALIRDITDSTPVLPA